MLWCRFGKSAGLVLTGFTAGLALVLVLGFAENGTEGGKDILAKNAFGDLRISTVPLDRDDARDCLVISKGDVPIICLYRTDSNEVNLFSISNGAHGQVALGMLTKSGISEFGLFGNEVHEGMRMPVFTMKASDKPSVWYKVRYTPSVAAVYDKGKKVSYRVEGEVYEDIDFDGQLDAKSVWNEKSEISSQSIFIDGQWIELGHREPDGQWKRRGGYDMDKSQADTIEGDKKVYFDFVWGKGWHRRPEGQWAQTGQ